MAHRPGRATSATEGRGATEAGETRPQAVAPARRETGTLRELAVLAAVALLIAILIKAFLIQAFYIPSPSMMPTLQHGDPDPRLPDMHPSVRAPLRRRDRVRLTPSDAINPREGLLGGAWHWLVQSVGVAQPDNPDYVKRVIGLPGDTIELRNGQLFRNGEAVASHI